VKILSAKADRGVIRSEAVTSAGIASTGRGDKSKGNLCGKPAAGIGAALELEKNVFRWYR